MSAAARPRRGSLLLFPLRARSSRATARRRWFAFVFALVVSDGALRADWDAGVTAFRSKRYSVAQREFEEVVRDRPDWSGGYLMLGRAQLLGERVSEAIATLRKAYDLDPSELEIQLALSQAYLAGHRATEATQLLSKVSAGAVPRERQALFAELQAEAALESGEPERAAAALQRAAAASPSDARVQRAAGIAALNAGDVAGAVAALERSVRLEADPAAQRVLVQALLRQGREAHGAAKLASYARAAEIARSLAAKDATFEPLLLLGEAELGAGNHAAASAAFAQASARNDSDWLPHYYAGQALTAAGRFPEAEAALVRARQRASAAGDLARVWRQLGYVQEKRQRFEEAAVAYQNAGDTAGLARVTESRRIAEHNRSAEEEERKLAELEARRETLRKQLEPPPPPP